MLVYLITNTVNGKQYIGQTRVSLHRRWLGHKSSHHTRSPLHSAIQKYGAQAFCLSLLDRKAANARWNKGERKFLTMDC